MVISIISVQLNNRREGGVCRKCCFFLICATMYFESKRWLQCLNARLNQFIKVSCPYSCYSASLYQASKAQMTDRRFYPSHFVLNINLSGSTSGMTSLEVVRILQGISFGRGFLLCIKICLKRRLGILRL